MKVGNSGSDPGKHLWYLYYFSVQTRTAFKEFHNSYMEGRGSALRAMIRSRHPKKDSDPRLWNKRDIRRSFADFILHQHSDKNEDKSFDNESMCKYDRKWKRTRTWLYRA